jgi:hypothetical protein
MGAARRCGASPCGQLRARSRAASRQPLAVQCVLKPLCQTAPDPQLCPTLPPRPPAAPPPRQLTLAELPLVKGHGKGNVLSLPQINLPQINSPEIPLTKLGIKTSEIKLPGFRLPGLQPTKPSLPSLPKVSLPSFGGNSTAHKALVTPEIKIPTVEIPSYTLTPKVSLPTFGMPAVKIPSQTLSHPIKLSTPHELLAAYHHPNGKGVWNFAKANKSISINAVKATPEIKLNAFVIGSPNASIPSISTPHLKTPSLTIPSFTLSKPTISKPTIGHPKLESGSVSASSLSGLGIPSMTMPNIALPSFSGLSGLTKPNKQLTFQLPSVPKPNFTMPTIPKPNLNININLPNISKAIDKANANYNGPKLPIEASFPSIQTPEISALPRFSIGAMNLTQPKTIQLPKVTGLVSGGAPGAQRHGVGRQAQMRAASPRSRPRQRLTESRAGRAAAAGRARLRRFCCPKRAP